MNANPSPKRTRDKTIFMRSVTVGSFAWFLLQA
jgi:hypothetical protein